MFAVSSDEEPLLEFVHIQTSEMKKSLANNPEAMLLDTTYPVNLENYNLHAGVTTDKNGFGQPTHLSFIRNEKEEVIRSFFKCSKGITR